ncbi:GtrA family protein [Stieleria neptunia]|uniref:GtrA family protein n=1 Tax=Stieleria neptunia TaxID=2527979 RepID=UPI0018D211B0
MNDVRAFRFVINKTAAFVIANGFSYWLNVRWVFTPGRHKRITEMSLFFGISSMSYLVGAQLGCWLISGFAISTSLAAVVCVGASFVMNFVLRKTLVFRRQSVPL